MWRSHRDESTFSYAELIAWEYVLPFKRLPILDSDREEARKLTTFLNEHFSSEELYNTYLRIKKEEK